MLLTFVPPSTWPILSVFCLPQLLNGSFSPLERTLMSFTNCSRRKGVFRSLDLHVFFFFFPPRARSPAKIFSPVFACEIVMSFFPFLWNPPDLHCTKTILFCAVDVSPAACPSPNLFFSFSMSNVLAPPSQFLGHRIFTDHHYPFCPGYGPFFFFLIFSAPPISSRFSPPLL